VIEGAVRTREEALDWVNRYLAGREQEMSERVAAHFGQERARPGQKG
jgi:hypothetical protein